MILSDKSLKLLGEGGLIEPYEPSRINPCSYNVRLADEFMIYADPVVIAGQENKTFKFNCKNLVVIPLGMPYNLEAIKIALDRRGVSLEPVTPLDEIDDSKIVAVRGLVLGTTIERFHLGDKLSAQYQGRSSYGRLGIQSHQTAGWIDAGFNGQITLEITSHGHPVVLEAGCEIGQVILSTLDQNCLNPYNGKYQDQTGVIESRSYLDK